MRFSRQEYWSGLPCPSSGNLSNPGIEPMFPALQADSLPSELPGKPIFIYNTYYNIYFTWDILWNLVLMDLFYIEI